MRLAFIPGKKHVKEHNFYARTIEMRPFYQYVTAPAVGGITQFSQMLHLIMLSTLCSSSIALPRLPAGLIANLVGDVAQAFPEGAVANVIPEEIILDNISPFLGFDEAMRTKDVFGWTDDQLVLQFSKLEPERIKSVIFRKLDNPAIDETAMLRQLDILLDDNPGLKFQPFEMFRVGRTGRGALVTRLLVRQPELGLAAVHASIFGDQLHVFEIAIGLETSPDTLREMLILAAQHSRPFVESGLHRISTLPPQMSQMFPRTWYNDLVTLCVGGNDQFRLYSSTEILEYLLTRPEWNPGTIWNLLDIMLPGFGNNDITTRLGREFLNSQLTFQAADGFQIIGGIDALDAAILQAADDPNYFIFNLDVVLRSIKDQVRT